MSHKFRHAVVIVSLALIALPCMAGTVDLGSAVAHAVDGSGIRGEFSILDSGNAETGLVIVGVATGLDPEADYLTLVYDRGALPGGPDACLPTGGLDGVQMFVGFWSVNEDGTGTLFVIKNGESYASLEEIGAVSIRLADFSLQACGRTHASN